MTVTEQPEFAPQYTREERVKYQVMAAAIAGTVVLVCNFVVFPQLLMLARHVECQGVYGFSGVGAVVWMAFVGLPLACGIAAGVFIIPRAVAALRARQYPAPGRKVVHQVRIRHGREAVLHAGLELALVAFFFSIAAWGAFQADAIARMAAHTQMDCVRVPER